MQKKILDIEMEATERISDARRMEHRYVERIRTGSQTSATHQQEQAHSYVRTAVEHKKAIVGNKAFRYEVEAEEACNA